MIKNIFLATTMIAAIFLWGKQLQARFTPVSTTALDGPVVLELFTSQGCSSCPPADKLLNELSDNPNIIPIAYHVTYWDYLSWKDTLGRKFADQRQRAYARFKRSSRVYTPQMIVNGGEEFVGSRKDSVNGAMRRATPVKRITMNGLTPAGTTIALPEVKSGDYVLWIAGMNASHTEKIQRGENRGKNITYKNTVLTLDQGERWDGNNKNITIDLKKNDKVDYYVIFAQNKAFGEIVAAGKISL